MNGRATDGRIDLSVVGGIAVITLDRAPVNALSAYMYTQLGEVAAHVAGDEGVRAAIVTGAGRCFCGGADLKELSGHTPDQRRAFWEVTADVRRRVLNIPVPVIAAIDGPAAGAGVAFASFCDYRIAAAGATLSMPEINVGSVGGGGEVLVRMGVPRGAIRYLMFSGKPVSAEEAQQVHLVDEVTKEGTALERARERAAVIAEKPRESLVAMKRAINLAGASSEGNEDVVAQTQGMTLEMMTERP